MRRRVNVAEFFEIDEQFALRTQNPASKRIWKKPTQSRWWKPSAVGRIPAGFRDQPAVLRYEPKIWPASGLEKTNPTAVEACEVGRMSLDF